MRQTVYTNDEKDRLHGRFPEYCGCCADTYHSSNTLVEIEREHAMWKRVCFITLLTGVFNHHNLRTCAVLAW